VSTQAALVADRLSNSGSFELVAISPGQFAARGALTFETARHAWQQGLDSFHPAGARELQVDCSGINIADSAGLTVLLDWLAHAQGADRSLCFANLPQELLAIARISEVDGLLQRGVGCAPENDARL